jgi:SPP1 gp7 family putative phage head morphogenesis protein
MIIKTLKNFASFINQKGWKQSFASGSDTISGGGSTQLTNEAQNSAWVFACLQAISGPVRSMPLRWFIGSGSDGEEIQDPDLADFWRAPAETSSGLLPLGDFLELSLHWINLKGQAVYILDDSWLVPGKRSPLLMARADRVSPIKRGDTILGWTFNDGSGGRVTLLPEQVIRPRFLNPYDDAEGLAPLQAARVAADADFAAGLFARNVAKSNGDQGVYVVQKSGTLSAEQQAQIVAALRQKSRLSRAGDYQPAFLTGDLSIEDPKIKTVDAAFVSGRSASQQEIFVAFGVPPSMSTSTASYSVGSASDWYRLINDTCLKHSRRLCEAMMQIEYRRTGRRLYCEQDFSSHPTMAAVRDERMKMAAEMWKTGVPWDVLSKVHNLGLPDFPGSDRAFLPMSLQAVEGVAKSELVTLPPVKALLSSSSAALIELRTLFEQRQAAPLQAPCNHDHGSKAAPDPKRLALWLEAMAARRPSEKLFESKLRRRLMDVRAETLANIERTEKTLAGVRQRGLLDLIFDLASFTASVISDFMAAHRTTISTALEQVAEEVGASSPWEMPPERVLTHLRQRENKIKDCCKVTHDRIKAALEDGINKGETSKELAGRVRAAFNVEASHAETIALTETSAAYGLSRHDALQGLGFERRQWLSAQDGNVRDAHVLMDGQSAPMDEPFVVPMEKGGTEPMLHPGDANASAGNVIRCRCVEIAARD